MERHVKAKIMLVVLVVVLVMAFGATALAGGDPEPICLPGKPCQVVKRALSGDPVPICLPGKPCSAGK
jgi:hypothetical protein